MEEALDLLPAWRDMLKEQPTSCRLSMSIVQYFRRRQPRNWRWILGRRMLLTAVALLAGWALKYEIAGPDGYLVLHRQARIYAQEQAQLRQLEQQNRALHRNVERLRSDPKAIESIARRQLYLARPGEVIYTYPLPKPKGKARRLRP